MNVVCIGAHPDDGEFYAGGTLIQWARTGHSVLVVSLTNGDVGHHKVTGEALARRRAAEARESARRAGIEERVLDHHDGELLPTLALRKQVVRLLRERQADLVLTHRPCDYHPDHRYTAVAVQDAAFMVTVPHFCPETPALRANPVFLYMMDAFTKPTPFQPDVAVAVDAVMDLKWAMLDAMGSQFYEWLPWLDNELDAVPGEAGERRAWLEERWGPFFREPARRARAALEVWYGPAAAQIDYAEFFEICEYGKQPARDTILDLFPFLPGKF